MAQTRAQEAAKKGRDLETQYLAPKRPRLRRKRPIQDTHDINPEPPLKRRRISRPTIPETYDNVADDTDRDTAVLFWAHKKQWPSRLFQPGMQRVLSRKRSSSSLSGRKRSSSSDRSDQRPREEKSAPYRDPRYETLLQTKGTYLETSEQGITSGSKQTCRDLLHGTQPTPEGSIFDDPVFEKACKNLQNKNESRIFHDISRFIVPRAESLALYDESKHLAILAESVNEGWNNSIPLTGTRPQPDYSVGFRRNAFTDAQLAKLAPHIGEFLDRDVSFLMATFYIYFPFLACEVKCGAAALDVADRQNAHSMTLAVRGVVELFRLVGRENEVHRQILAFSISHDHRSVRIYGYYPVIDKKDTKCYRHPIRTFDFTEMDGKERWAAYQFVKNVYDNWMPGHFKSICSAIDQLPSNVDSDVQALSESTGLSQNLGSQLALSEADSESLLTDKDDLAGKFGPIATPDTSFSKPASAKRRKSPKKKVVETSRASQST